MWVLVPMIYEKWVNPSNKNDKHYRVIFRGPTGRRVSKTKFKTASAVVEFDARFYGRVCTQKEGIDVVSEQGTIRA